MSMTSLAQPDLPMRTRQHRRDAIAAIVIAKSAAQHSTLPLRQSVDAVIHAFLVSLPSEMTIRELTEAVQLGVREVTE